MKKTFILLIVFLVICGFVNAQITIKGHILDSESKKGVEYACVYKEGTNIGCICDSLGYFVLDDLKVFPDSLTVSCVGYDNKKVYKKYLKTSNEVSVDLELKSIHLNEVIIKNEKLKEKTLSLGTSSRKWNRCSPLYFASQKMRYFTTNKTKAFIDNFSFYIQGLYGGKKARIRIYTVDSIKHTPQNDLLNSNLIVDKLKEGWNTVDLKKYKIRIPKDGFFIGLESVVSDKDCFVKDGENKYAGRYSDLSIGCTKEQTVTASRYLFIGDYRRDGEVYLSNSITDWSLDSSNMGFDLLYKVKITYYE